jgi:hypothetical protein
MAAVAGDDALTAPGNLRTGSIHPEDSTVLNKTTGELINITYTTPGNPLDGGFAEDAVTPFAALNIEDMDDTIGYDGAKAATLKAAMASGSKAVDSAGVKWDALDEMVNMTFGRAMQRALSPDALATNPFAADVQEEEKAKKARATELRHLTELPLPVLEACLARFVMEELAELEQVKQEFDVRQELIEQLLGGKRSVRLNLEAPAAEGNAAAGAVEADAIAEAEVGPTEPEIPEELSEEYDPSEALKRNDTLHRKSWSVTFYREFVDVGR